LHYTINHLLTVAAGRGASDVHLTAALAPQMRIEGAWTPMGSALLTAAQCRALAEAILGPERMAVFLRQLEYDASYALPGVGSFRVNCFVQRGSVGLAIRLLPPEALRFEQLGLPVATMEALCSLPHGLILLAGPTGSGKSTTLAAMIGHINHNRRSHIITIEDPIEYVHQHGLSIVNQREVGTDTKTFAMAMIHALRQQPDVIMVGEIRDPETVRTAIMLAETGHLLMSSIHTGEVVQGLTRLVDMFPAEQQSDVRVSLSLTLRCVIVQQLLPSRRDEGRRVLAVEVLLSTPAVQNLVRGGKFEQLYSLLQTQQEGGMRTMNQSLLELWQKGDISRDIALARSAKPPELEDLMKSLSRSPR
jgi:twitching motility protein PilT